MPDETTQQKVTSYRNAITTSLSVSAPSKYPTVAVPASIKMLDFSNDDVNLDTETRPAEKKVEPTTTQEPVKTTDTKVETQPVQTTPTPVKTTEATTQEQPAKQTAPTWRTDTG